MSPLRQLQWSASSNRYRLYKRCTQFTPAGRNYSALPLKSFPALASRATSKLQIYQSLSNDPFVNLSIENFLLENSPLDSKILFLYVNRPCVVIGRNQNPWLESNLHLLDQKTRNNGDNNGALKHALFVRRRSGGGAVFHDEGNLNFSVICPKSIFDRDKHAEMVVRALKRIGAVNTRVNDRHDIVLGQDPEKTSAAVVQVGTNDAESPPVEQTPHALKISGSAYKLSRNRALHHGTCLIDSPNLREISRFLRSPARPYLKAKGVESVRSPVGNISSVIPGIEGIYLIQTLISEIMAEFAKMYEVDNSGLLRAQRAYANNPEICADQNWVVGALTESIASDEPEVENGVRELQSLDWKYNQSPQFTFSSHPTDDDPRPRPDIPEELLHPASRIFLRLKSGAIIESHISISPDAAIAETQANRVHEILSGRKLHEISDWKSIFDAAGDVLGPEEHDDVGKLVQWLNSKLGH